MESKETRSRREPRILLVRLSAIGDIVFASGMLPALKAKYPGARISWLAEPIGASLLREHPLVDEVIVWPRAEWMKLARSGSWLKLQRAVRDFRTLLHAREFDLAIDLQGLAKSGFLAALSGARRRVSLGGLEGSGWLAHTVISRKTTDRRIGTEYAQCARALGCPEEAFRLNLAFSEATTCSAEAILAKSIGPDWRARRLVACCPFTTRPQKHWFPEHWQALVKQLQASDPLVELVVLGAPDNRADAEAWFARTPRPVANLCGQTSLLQAAAVISEAAVVVGVDTGLTHMGIARGRPTVALFGSTRPYEHAREAPLKTLFREMDCAPCRRHPTCGGAFTCLRELSPELVAREVGVYLRGDGVGD